MYRPSWHRLPVYSLAVEAADVEVRDCCSWLVSESRNIRSPDLCRPPSRSFLWADSSLRTWVKLGVIRFIVTDYHSLTISRASIKINGPSLFMIQRYKEFMCQYFFRHRHIAVCLRLLDRQQRESNTTFEADRIYAQLSIKTHIFTVTNDLWVVQIILDRPGDL